MLLFQQPNQRDEELLVPCSTTRQGHDNHGDFCRKSWRFVTSREADPQGKGEGCSVDLTTPSHQGAAQGVSPFCQKRSSQECLWTQSLCQEGSRKTKQNLVFCPCDSGQGDQGRSPAWHNPSSTPWWPQHIQEGFQLGLS